MPRGDTEYECNVLLTQQLTGLGSLALYENLMGRGLETELGLGKISSAEIDPEFGSNSSPFISFQHQGQNANPLLPHQAAQATNDQLGRAFNSTHASILQFQRAILPVSHIKSMSTSPLT